MAYGLRNFSKQMIIEILSFIPLFEYKNIMLVNKLFKSCAKSDYLWRNSVSQLFSGVSENYYRYFLNNSQGLARIWRSFYKILYKFSEKQASQLVKSMRLTSNPKLHNIIPHYFCETDSSLLDKKSSYFEDVSKAASKELFWAHLLYNGQGRPDPGFFGTYEFYDVYVSLRYPSVGQLSNPDVLLFSGEGNERLIIFQDPENKFKNGEGAVYCNTGIRDTVLYLASSFTEYIEDYANKIYNGTLNIVDGKALLYECNDYSSANSEYGIKITATALFIPHLSQNRRLLWSYLVKIEEDNPDEKWKLTTRSWRIEDSNGDVQTVDRQPGVIGLYPKVFRGCEVTRYTSCCYLKTPSGRMSGFFTFKNENGRSVDVNILPFRLEVPKGSRLVQV